MVKIEESIKNMSKIGVMREEKRMSIEEEKMDIYEKIDGRMGMKDMSEEMEEMDLRYINKDEWREVKERIEEIMEKKRGILKKIEKDIYEILEKKGIKERVKRRKKKKWQVLRKMERKGI